MKPYEIFVDASIDMDKKIFSDSGLRMIPMDYTFGGEQRQARQLEDDALMERFYAGQRNGDVTHTSQVTPGGYLEAFEPALREGKDVLYIALSGGLTRTMDSCQMTIAELSRKYPGVGIFPVDSLSATGGMGLLAERAIRNRERGLDARENAQDLLDVRSSVCHVFMVEDLMYLKRGGRVSAGTAVVGTMLNIKALLVIDQEGKLPTVAKKRGEKAAMREMLARFRASYRPGISNRVYVVHADAPARAEAMKQLLLQETPDLDIHTTMLCPIIGAHTGPGMFAIIYWGDRDIICKSE